MHILPSLSQRQNLLIDYVFDNELLQLKQFISQLPTLDFIESTNKDSPLILAVSNSEEEIVECLLAHGASPNFTNGQTLPLHAAIERSIYSSTLAGDARMPETEEDPVFLMKLLLQYGADFTLKSPAGESAYVIQARLRSRAGPPPPGRVHDADGRLATQRPGQTDPAVAGLVPRARIVGTDFKNKSLLQT